MKDMDIPKRLKQTYSNMKYRCYNPKDKRYKYYGGKGITVCDEWLENRREFFEWAINNGYEDSLTIDRKDSNGNYSPDNCRWATYEEQANNRTNNVFIEVDGITKTIPQWSKETGLSIGLIRNRFENGEKDLFREPEESLIKVKINGEYKSLYELSDISGIPYSAIYQRYNSGWEI